MNCEVCYSEDDEEEEEMCSICYIKMGDHASHTLECSHKFHTDCILKWFRSKQDTCPLCRVHPVVRLKAPDIFHRAKKLIDQEVYSLNSDAFVRDKMNVIEEAERMKKIHESNLSNTKEKFKNILKPKKDELLKQYRILRTQFKDRSSPLLKMLDEIDDNHNLEKEHIRKEIIKQQKKKREAMRDIGLHNIEPQGLNSYSES